MPRQRNQRDNIALGLLLFFFLGVAPFAHASQETGSIDGTLKYAFSNVGGWINFAPAQSRVTVTDYALTGYAWSANDGWINLAPAQGGVKNTTSGNLSGFAWDQAAGWVNFSGVTIDASGRFHGQAVGGTVNGASYAINFDCSTCNVTTDWRPAAVRVYPGSISPVYIPPSSSSAPTAGNTTPPAAEPPAGEQPPAQSLPANGTSGGTSPIPSPGGVVQQGGRVIPTTQYATSTKPITKAPITKPAASTTVPVSIRSFWSSLMFPVLGILLLIILFVAWRLFL